MPGHVSPDVIKKRGKELRDLSERLKIRFHDQQVGARTACYLARTRKRGRNSFELHACKAYRATRCHHAGVKCFCQGRGSDGLLRGAIL